MGFLDIIIYKVIGDVCMRKIIASLDIGSHTIKLVVGEIVRNKLNILACVDTPSRGIKKDLLLIQIVLLKL